MKIEDIAEYLDFNETSVIIRLYDTKLESFTDTEITTNQPFELFCDLTLISISCKCYDEVQCNPEHELCLVLECW